MAVSSIRLGVTDAWTIWSDKFDRISFTPVIWFELHWTIPWNCATAAAGGMGLLQGSAVCLDAVVRGGVHDAVQIERVNYITLDNQRQVHLQRCRRFPRTDRQDASRCAVKHARSCSPESCWLAVDRHFSAQQAHRKCPSHQCQCHVALHQRQHNQSPCVP